MNRVFKSIQTLLPSGKAWDLVPSKTFRKFIYGLTGYSDQQGEILLDAVRDWIPKYTKNLDEWEYQFALDPTGYTESQRIGNLYAAWRGLVGGQSIAYINSVLEAAGFDVRMYNWWETEYGQLYPPNVKNPFEFIFSPDFPICDGFEYAADGEEVMQDGGYWVAPGYLLVNRYDYSYGEWLACDNLPDTYDNSESANDGNFSEYFIRDGNDDYRMNPDPATFPFYIYAADLTFPEVVTLPRSEQKRLEYLLRKHCPATRWIGVLVQYED